MQEIHLVWRKALN